MNVKHILQNTSEDDHTSLFKKLYCPIGSTAREAFGCFFQEIRNLIKFSKYSDFFFLVTNCFHHIWEGKFLCVRVQA